MRYDVKVLAAFVAAGLCSNPAPAQDKKLPPTEKAAIWIESLPIQIFSINHEPLLTVNKTTKVISVKGGKGKQATDAEIAAAFREWAFRE